MLSNKKIVIIGSTTGNGLSAVKASVGAGAQEVVVGRNRFNCKAASRLLSKAATVYNGDTAAPVTAEIAISYCIKTFGDFDGLYHVAGASGRKFGVGSLDELTPKGWNINFEMKLTGLPSPYLAAIRRFRELRKKPALSSI